MTSLSAPPKHQRRLPLYWILQSAGWGFYGALNVLYFGGFKVFATRLVLSNLTVAAIGLLLSHALRTVLRSQLRRGGRRWIGAAAMGIPLCAVVLAVVTSLLQRTIGGVTPTYSLLWLTLALTPNYSFLFGLWAACYLGIKVTQRWRESELSRARALAAARQAELARLRAQFEPHFLFNTLNTINALIGEDPELAREGIRHLSALLRVSLTVDANALAPLSAEWALVSDYLRLEELRFPGGLAVESQLSPAALTCSLPAFALQTLIENAVKYGAPNAQKVRQIAIVAEKSESRLCIQVVNAGTLHSARQGTTGVGLNNLRERLGLLCGPNASFSLEETSGPSVVARLEIPQS